MPSEELKSMHSQDWVSKSDLASYLRCPYAFFLVDSGQVTFNETVNTLEMRRIEEGIKIHAEATSQAPPRYIEPIDLPKVIAEESVKLLNLPVFENRELRIYGQPDGIDTAHGALIPMEIKSHGIVKHSDKLELAFYWLLFEPMRTKTISPIGHLLLQGIGTRREIIVPITPRLIEEVHELIKDVRNARLNGVTPSKFCSCHICGGAKREEMLRSTYESKDISLIRGVGSVFGRALSRINVSTYTSLITTDTAEIVGKLRQLGCRVSPSQVATWKQHAESYASSTPVVFGDIPSLNESFIAIDLEYEQGKLIWLMGACVVEQSGHCRYFTLWSENSEEELTSLKRLFEIISLHSQLQIITWNGRGADFPQLRSAHERHGLCDDLALIESRHCDLYQCLTKAVRFPIPQLGLHEVASYYRLPQSTKVRNGIQAMLLFQEYVNSQDENKKEDLKLSLLDYSLKDLESLVGIVHSVRTLTKQIGIDQSAVTPIG